MGKNEQGGCISTVPLAMLDIDTMQKIYEGKLKPLKVDCALVPRKIPFLRKKVWYVELQYMEDKV